MATVAEAFAAALRHHQAGQLHEAERIYRQILAADPRHADALHYLGVIGVQSGHAAAAIELIEKAIAIDPYNATYHGNLGTAYGAARRFEDAIGSFRAALELNPGFLDAWNNLGNALVQERKLDEAVAAFRRALRLAPNSAETHNYLGSALLEQDKVEEAVASYRQALRLKPQWAEGRYNLGVALVRLGNLALAEENYLTALRLDPQHADAHNNLGNVYREQGRFEEALASYERAIALKPGLALARKNRGMAWLRLGDCQRGWPEYEWRWKCSDSPPRDFRQPAWDGSPLLGRTILLHAEQGLGDTLQFIRYAPLVQARGGRVVVECQPPLMKLLERCAGIEQLVPRGQPLPEFELHAPLVSLPGLLGTTLDNVPADVPYVFVDEQRQKRWRQEIAKLGGFTVGINWQGNPSFKADRFRSIPLVQFAPLAAIEGVRLVSLQRGPGVDQLEQLRGFEVVQLPASTDDAEAFADTAAAMQSLDLVVTSDTSIAQSGSRTGGAGLWIPFSADWRWLLAREDSPWYPTLRLFRPQQVCGWEEVFQRVAREVRGLAGAS